MLYFGIKVKSKSGLTDFNSISFFLSAICYIQGYLVQTVWREKGDFIQLGHCTDFQQLDSLFVCLSLCLPFFSRSPYCLSLFLFIYTFLSLSLFYFLSSPSFSYLCLSRYFFLCLYFSFSPSLSLSILFSV